MLGKKYVGCVCIVVNLPEQEYITLGLKEMIDVTNRDVKTQY